MRYLTIERQKSFVACLTTMKVYIEDPTADDLEINGVRCRKLGTLKNGEKGNFRISESAAKVYVIADKLSKELCNNFYQLPAGPESVTVSGKCRLNPGTANAFCFQDGDSQETAPKSKKKLLLIGGIALAVVVVAAVAACMIFALSTPKGETKVFSVDDFHIALTTDFTEFDVEGFERAMDSEHVALLILQEEFTLMEGFGDYTLEEYGELVLSNNPKAKDSKLSTKNGVMYFEYESVNMEDGKNYRYIVTMYKGPDAFWMVQYIVHAEEAVWYRDDIFDWAESVAFMK